MSLLDQHVAYRGTALNPGGPTYALGSVTAPNVFREDTQDTRTYIVNMELEVLVVATDDDDAGIQAMDLLDGEAWAVSGKVLAARPEEVWSSALRG